MDTLIKTKKKCKLKLKEKCLHQINYLYQLNIKYMETKNENYNKNYY